MMSQADEILQEIGNELAFVKSPRLERFAAQLRREDRVISARADQILEEIGNELAFVKSTRLEKFASQLKREDPVEIPVLYPQFTCEWFIEGLDWCWPSWRHEFKRPKAPPPETSEIQSVVVKKIKTEVTRTVLVPKIQPRVVATAESHWEKLPPEIQEKIEDMAARAVHREKLNKVCGEEEECLLIDRCFVCQKEEWGMLWTPCCRKPAHLECCPAPVHIYPGLRRVCMIIDMEGFVLPGNRVIVREVGWCDMHGVADSFHFKPDVPYHSLSLRDRRTVGYVFHNIHALPFEPRPQEKAIEGSLVDAVVKTLHDTLSTFEKDVVAYKGGTLEKQVSSRLNIPHVDL